MSEKRKYISRISGVLSTNYLEIMAGANKWHQVAREVFIEKFLQEKHEGVLSLVDSEELAEKLIHQGKRIVAGEEFERCGYSAVAKELCEKFRQEVDEIGEGDVVKYAKRKSGKTRKELWGF